MPEIPLKKLDLLLKFQLMWSLPDDLISKLEIHQHALSFDELAILEKKSLTPPVAAVKPAVTYTSANTCQEEASLNGRVAELEMEIKRIQVRDRKCFKCGRNGHFAKECRSRYPAPQGKELGPRRGW